MALMENYSDIVLELDEAGVQVLRSFRSDSFTGSMTAGAHRALLQTLRQIESCRTFALQIVSENQKVQLPAEGAPDLGLDGGIQQLSQAEYFLPEFQFDREAIAVLKDFVSQAEIFWNPVVILQLKRFAFAGKIIECTFFLCLLYALFDDLA
jgi:hypothetical protein